MNEIASRSSHSALDSGGETLDVKNHYYATGAKLLAALVVTAVRTCCLAADSLSRDARAHRAFAPARRRRGRSRFSTVAGCRAPKAPQQLTLPQRQPGGC